MLETKRRIQSLVREHLPAQRFEPAFSFPGDSNLTGIDNDDAESRIRPVRWRVLHGGWRS